MLAPLVTGGKAIALAVTAAQRSPLLPDVMTTAEAGVPALSAENWYAMMAPANLPAAVMGKLTGCGAWRGHGRRIPRGARQAGRGHRRRHTERLAQWVATETAKWAPIARAAGIKLD